MKNKNYKNSRGAGDGDLSAGLLGMMNGGDAMEYPKMMMKGGSSGSLTYAQKGKETSSGSPEAEKRMTEFAYPKDLKTSSDSTSYRAGYESSQNIVGGGRAGITANPNYKRGYNTGSKKKKK